VYQRLPIPEKQNGLQVQAPRSATARSTSFWCRAGSAVLDKFNASLR
jgi:hypothetical protein